MADFVSRDSIVRRIWGESDTILLVFAGSAAEFALNRAVDWLFFTGKLPGDPIGRVFSTASFAADIVFADEPTAAATLARIRGIHQAVERERGGRIPDWAHRDVLYMLIDYSARAFELLHRPLARGEREDLFDVFRRVGDGLGVLDVPATYDDWLEDRERHLARDLVYSDQTAELYAQYRRHLGAWRYALLLQVQALLAPEIVRRLLGRRPVPGIGALVAAYRLMVRAGLREAAHRALLPARYLGDVRKLDVART